MGEFGVVGEEEKESETHTYNGSLAPGVKVVKQVMIMKGKDDSENRTEREEGGRGDFRVFWQPSRAPSDRQAEEQRATCE